MPYLSDRFRTVENEKQNMRFPGMAVMTSDINNFIRNHLLYDKLRRKQPFFEVLNNFNMFSNNENIENWISFRNFIFRKFSCLKHWKCLKMGHYVLLSSLKRISIDFRVCKKQRIDWLVGKSMLPHYLLFFQRNARSVAVFIIIF